MDTINLGVVIPLMEIQQTILRLRFGQGYSIENIAQQLQLKLRTIEKLLEMALRKEFLKEINQQIL
jgi:DNA-directed RNA polymerase specialized sigma24 family protein